MLAHRTGNHDFRRPQSVAVVCALFVAPFALALMARAPRADATPNFARQTGRSCNFCHSGVPRLNSTGLAFRDNGFRFPESDKPSDSDHKGAPAQ